MPSTYIHKPYRRQPISETLIHERDRRQAARQLLPIALTAAQADETLPVPVALAGYRP